MPLQYLPWHANATRALARSRVPTTLEGTRAGGVVRK
jgi:hypothetical protein